jgi:hypothetical protein
MFCLLCHEKISRLRAWRTKSEFCCDEHAEIYKRQTLERLLTDQENSKPGEAPPLPVENTPTSNASTHSGDEEEEKIPASETLARFEQEDAAASTEPFFKRSADTEPADREDPDEGLQELWRLAEEVSPAAESAELSPAVDGGDDDGWGDATARLSDASSELRQGGFGGLGANLGSSLDSLGGGLGVGSRSVKEQTAEEALAALRALSSGPRRAAARLDDSSDELRTLLSARESGVTAEPGLELSASEEDLPGSLDDMLAGEESLPPFDAAALPPLEDDELPSLLERLTEHASEANGAQPEPVLAAEQAADLHAAEESVEQFQPAPLAEEENFAERPAASLGAPDSEPAQAIEEVSAAETGLEDAATLDALEEAVELHLGEPNEPATPRLFSHKVVPFPLSRPKPAAPYEPEPAEPAASRAAAAAHDERARPAKPGKGSKGNAIPGDLSRLQLKPVAVMFGLEPSLYEPGEGGPEWPVNGVGGPPAQDGMVEPPLCYPNPGGVSRAAAHPPFHVHARLCPLLPEAPESPALEDEMRRTNWPDFALPCESPLPLALGRNGHSARPWVGTERAWMFQIEPALAEGPEFALQLPNGKRHAPWQALQLPAALMAGVASQHGSGKLDLSGPQGKFEPPVDTLCRVFPQLGELGGGSIPRQSSSKAPGDEFGRWVPPTVLDPRFDVERPAGRDLSDFG